MATVGKIFTHVATSRASIAAINDIFDRNYRIIRAILLQDMRTRFGRTYFSYLISVLWPLAHLSIILVAYAFMNKIAPVGGDPLVFAATGVLPYIMCVYPARQIAVAVAQNRQMLNIPIVRPLHLIIARAVIEPITASIVFIIFCAVLYASGYEIFPRDQATAVMALLATVYFGIGYGFFGIVLVALFGPFSMIVIILSLVGLYIASGVYLPPYMFSDSALQIEYYNPLFNCSTWMRSAYYIGYDAITINKSMIFWAGTVLLMLGLLGERYLRGKFF